MLKALRFLFYTELTWLLRRSQEWLYPLGFFLIVISLFPFAFTPDPLFLQRIIPGGIWIAALLASLLSVEHIFHADIEEGYLEQVILNTVPFSAALLTKLTAQWVATELPLILLTPLIGGLFHLSFQTITALTLSLLIGTPTLTLVGSLCAALTCGLRQPGILLGFLMFPLVMPVLIFGMTMVQQAGDQLSYVSTMAFLTGIMILSITLLPLAIAVTLKIGMEEG